MSWSAPQGKLQQQDEAQSTDLTLPGGRLANTINGLPDMHAAPHIQALIQGLPSLQSIIHPSIPLQQGPSCFQLTRWAGSEDQHNEPVTGFCFGVG